MGYREKTQARVGKVEKMFKVVKMKKNSSNDFTVSLYGLFELVLQELSFVAQN